MYYLMNANDDSILEASELTPKLTKEAEYFKCPVYLIKGERIGEIVYPAPLPVAEPPADTPADEAAYAAFELEDGGLTEEVGNFTLDEIDEVPY